MEPTREVPKVSSPTPDFLLAVENAGLSFDHGDLERLQAYLELLYEANSRMNLTGVRDPREAWKRHIFDSLTLLPWIAGVAEQQDQVRVLDVGSGGGLPGIPLACVLGTNVQLSMLESTGKKADFLRSAAEKLGLAGVEVIQDRAENAGQSDAHRGQYDVVVSRAVGRLQVLLEFTVPFGKENGLILAIKGAKAEEEIAEAKQALYMLHAEVIQTTQTETGRIIVIEKRRKTPARYPRMPGEPAKRPLGTP